MKRFDIINGIEIKERNNNFGYMLNLVVGSKFISTDILAHRYPNEKPMSVGLFVKNLKDFAKQLEEMIDESV